MEKKTLKKYKFDLGSMAQKKGEEFSKVPLIKLFYASIAISILVFVLVLSTQPSLPPEIPLYFGLAEGQEQLAPPANLLFPSILALGITIVNSIIVLKLNNPLLQKILAVTSISVTFFSFITTVRILLLVGSF